MGREVREDTETITLQEGAEVIKSCGTAAFLYLSAKCLCMCVYARAYVCVCVCTYFDK